MNKNENFSGFSMNDIVFEKRNKIYGAYLIRETYNKHLIKSMFISFSFFFLAIFSPKIIDFLGIVKNIPALIPTIITKIEDIDIIKVIEVNDDKGGGGNTQSTTPVYKAVKVDDIDTTIKEEPDTSNIFTSNNNNPAPGVIGLGPGNGGTGIDSSTKVFVDQNSVFKNVDQRAHFIGGDEALREFLEANLIYPQAEEQEGIEGEAVVIFVVGIDGKVEQVKIERSSDSENLDNEAMRVIRKTSKMFVPGKINGKSVRSYCRIPIGFILR